MLGSKDPNYDTCGLFCTSRSHNLQNRRKKRGAAALVIFQEYLNILDFD